jgi:hypothetical protein
MKIKMKLSELFPSKYLKAADLGGRQIAVVIKRINEEEIGMARDRRLVMYFEPKDVDDPQKPMVLNKTNARKIAELFGDETNDWVGCQIMLYEAQVEFQGVVGPALRIKGFPQTVQRTKRQAPPAHMEGWDTPEVGDGPPPGGGSQKASLILEADTMAGAGIEKFRSWRDQLSPEEYEILKPEFGRLLQLAATPRPPALSPEALKISKRRQ